MVSMHNSNSFLHGTESSRSMLAQRSNSATATTNSTCGCTLCHQTFEVTPVAFMTVPVKRNAWSDFFLANPPPPMSVYLAANPHPMSPPMYNYGDFAPAVPNIWVNK